jgi:hypothetical protein
LSVCSSCVCRTWAAKGSSFRTSSRPGRFLGRHVVAPYLQGCPRPRLRRPPSVDSPPARLGECMLRVCAENRGVGRKFLATRASRGAKADR